MKVTPILAAFGSLLSCAIVVTSCVKETGKEIAKETSNFSNKALVQVFDATVNSASTHIFVDAKQVTGSALAYGGVYPSSSYAFQVDAGLRGFSIRNTTAGTTQLPIIFSENLDMAKFYTIFMYDTTTAAKQITVPTNIVVPSDTSARVRLANFIYNTGGAAVPAVDVFSKLKKANLATNLAQTQVTDFIAYPSRLLDTLIVRETGTLNQLAVLNGFVATPKRSYTVIYRGSHRGTRTLSAFTNY
jgi:hypothetical protein